MFPQNSYFETLIPNVLLFGDWTIEGNSVQIKSYRWGPHVTITPYNKRKRHQSSFSIYHMRTWQERKMSSSQEDSPDLETNGLAP